MKRVSILAKQECAENLNRNNSFENFDEQRNKISDLSNFRKHISEDECLLWQVGEGEAALQKMQAIIQRT